MILSIDDIIYMKIRDRIGMFAVDILPDGSYYNSEKLDNCADDIRQIVIRELDKYSTFLHLDKPILSFFFDELPDLKSININFSNMLGPLLNNFEIMINFHFLKFDKKKNLKEKIDV